MKWSLLAWEHTIPVFDKITAHPFIQELMQGTLPEEKFEYYIQQDALYLAEFGKVLFGIAGKFENSDYSRAFHEFANATVEVEKALHAGFRQQFNVSKPEGPSPSCLLYTSYLQSCLYTKDLCETLASVLPCFLIYLKVGNYIISNQTKDRNPYQNWINTYAGEEFETSVNTAIAICDAVASESTLEQQEKMTDAFLLAAKMEWMFWDSAYQLDKWKV